MRKKNKWVVLILAALTAVMPVAGAYAEELVDGSIEGLSEELSDVWSDEAGVPGMNEESTAFGLDELSDHVYMEEADPQLLSSEEKDILTSQGSLERAGASAAVLAAHEKLLQYLKKNGEQEYGGNGPEDVIYYKSVDYGDGWVKLQMNPTTRYFGFSYSRRAEEIGDRRYFCAAVLFHDDLSDPTIISFDINQSLVIAETAIKPENFHGTEDLNFTAVKNSVYATDAEMQKVANAHVKNGYKAWNAVLGQLLGESMKSMGFGTGNSVAPTPAVPMFKTTITGFYNSVKGADIRWTYAPGCGGYRVYRFRSAEGEKLVAEIENPLTLQCYDPDIKDNCWGRVYVYYVYPVYDPFMGHPYGEKSNKVTLQRLAPMKITSLKNSAAGKVTCTYACTVNANKAFGYEIQYALSKQDLFDRKGTFKKVSVNGRKNLSKVISGFSKGKTYYFRVRCYVDYEHSVTHQKTKTWSQYSDVKSIKISK